MNTSVNLVNTTQAPSPLAVHGDPRASGDSDPAAILPDPGVDLGDGSISQLAVLLTRADEQDRAAARQIEDAADKAATQAANERVQQLREKADADRSQGIAQGLLGIAGGVCTALGGFAAKDSAGRLGLEGGGQAMPAFGQVVGAQFKSEAEEADANAAQLDAQAQADIRRYDEAHDDEEAASQSLQKVEQFLDQAEQAENATRLAAATFRA